MFKKILSLLLIAILAISNIGMCSAFQSIELQNEGNYIVDCLPGLADFRQPEMSDSIYLCDWMAVNGIGYKYILGGWGNDVEFSC